MPVAAIAAVTIVLSERDHLVATVKHLQEVVEDGLGDPGRGEFRHANAGPFAEHTQHGLAVRTAARAWLAFGLVLIAGAGSWLARPRVMPVVGARVARSPSDRRGTSAPPPGAGTRARPPRSPADARGSRRGYGPAAAQPSLRPRSAVPDPHTRGPAGDAASVRVRTLCCCFRGCPGSDRRIVRAVAALTCRAGACGPSLKEHPCR